jgi:multidrug resistance efflux pump
MNIMLNRLDPNVPDPVESRRRAAGRLVRIAYATVVFGILGFVIVYFGRPLVYLSGPGVVSSPHVVVSLPFVVQVKHVNVTRGSTVKSGEEIGQVWSPQHDGVVATYMRALADIASRSAELRIKARVAQESLDAARSYLQVTEEAVGRVEATSSASTVFRIQVFRERAAARKALVSLEAESAEATAQLAYLDQFSRQVREHLDQAEGNFADGRVFAPIAGIVPTSPARTGQSVVAGTPFAEILDSSDVFVDWYIPNERLIDPKVGNKVIVVFGNWRLSGTITEILPVSEVYGGTQSALSRERVATQIARIRFGQNIEPPALNTTVYVHMYYTDFAYRLAGMLVRVFGLDRA